MFGGFIYPDGQMFVDHIEPFIEFQKAFLLKLQKMRETNVFTYPVMTYNLVYRDGKFQDEEFARWLSNHNRKWADANFLISAETTSAASCCRLVSNFKDLKGLVLNSIGGSSLDIGSVVVTTLNLAGYAEQAKDEDDFIRIVKEKTKLVIKINDVVRDIIKRNIEKGLLPNYSYDLMKLSKQMNTVGVIGFPEAAKKYGYLVQDEFGYWNYTDEGIEFGRKVLNTINETKDSFDFEYSINLEQVPAENCAVKLAYANSLLYGTKEYILGNQWIPLKDKASIKERTKAAGIFDRMCGGGAITHIQIDAPIKDEETAWNLLNYIAKQGVIYFAFNLKINVDEEKHTFTTKTCPICGAEPVDTYQRCVGYLVPTKSWSEGRKRELSERDWMNLNDPILS